MVCIRKIPTYNIRSKYEFLLPYIPILDWLKYLISPRLFVHIWLNSIWNQSVGIFYHPLSQATEHDAVSIQYYYSLVLNYFPGLNSSWVSNDFSVWILDRVHDKLLSNCIPFFGGLYSPLSDIVKFPGCVWPRVSYLMS